MRFDKFTLKVQEALQEAQGLASQYGHQAIDSEHLLVSFRKHPEGILPDILKKLGADPGRIEREIGKATGETAERLRGRPAAKAYISRG